MRWSEDGRKYPEDRMSATGTYVMSRLSNNRRTVAEKIRVQTFPRGVVAEVYRLIRQGTL